MKKTRQDDNLPRGATADTAAAPSPRSFMIRIRMSVVIFIALLWSYGIRHTAQPIAMPSVLEGILMAAVAAGFYYMYRFHEIAFRVDKSDAFVVAGYFVSFLALNFRTLGESLVGDEQCHALDSTLFIHVMRGLYRRNSLPLAFLNMPLNEACYYFSAVFIVVVAIAVGLWRAIDERKRPRLFYAYLFVIMAATSVVFSMLPHAPCRHPPMRLLPLFLGHTVLGANTASFRIPGILCTAALSFIAYRLLLRKIPDSRPLALLGGFAMCMIPTVMYTSAAAEPSIWAFAIVVVCALAMYMAHETDNFTYMVAAGTLVGVGSLMRQNIVVLWPTVFLFILLNPGFRARLVRNTALAVAPGVLCLPYFLAIRSVGVGAQFGGSPVQNILQSISSGVGPKAILNSTGLFWVVFTLIGSALVILLSRNRLRWFYLTFVPAYGLYYSIQPWLWGVGRYQAEYVAPFAAITVFCLAIMARPALRPVLAGILVFLCLYSDHVYRTMYDDVHYETWPRQRVTTSRYFPFDEALRFIEQQEAGGSFVILGGCAVRPDISLSLTGFTFTDLLEYCRIDEKFQKFVESPQCGELQSLFELLRTNNVKYLLVRYGEKMELQHRGMNYGGNMHSLFAQLSYYYGEQRGRPGDYVYLHTFYGRHAGAIDIYGLAGLRYGPYSSAQRLTRPQSQ